MPSWCGNGRCGVSRDALLSAVGGVILACSAAVCAFLTADLPGVIRQTADLPGPSAGWVAVGCSSVSWMPSQRQPLPPDAPASGLWGFARSGGIQVQACGPGTLSFRTERRATTSSASRWEVYLGDRLLSSGLTGNGPSTAQQVSIPDAGPVFLIFTNAYTGVDVALRRTLYFSQVRFTADR